MLPIKLLVLDVDGTLTDGGLYLDSTGNEMKKFSVRDGAGLMLARAAGIRVMILTGRESEPVRRRAAELHLDWCVQNCKDKRAYLAAFLAEQGLSKEQAAYVGDDWNDLAAMQLCGFVACPANAAPEVAALADYVCPQKGGDGAVRGAVEYLLRGAGLFETTLKAAFGAEVPSHV